MNISKTILAAGLLLAVLPAGQAFASAPADVGAFNAKCLALGGLFGAGAGGVYSCDFLDGTMQVCEFAPTASCDMLDGPTHNKGPHKFQISIKPVPIPPLQQFP
jgi:hypothetical protein